MDGRVRGLVGEKRKKMRGWGSHWTRQNLRESLYSSGLSCVSREESQVHYKSEGPGSEGPGRAW